MNKEEMLWKLEGLQTVDTVQEKLGYTRQSTINLLSRLKKEGHVTIRARGKKARIYKITMRKQRPREQGMFDIINKYSPNMKLNEWYDHQIHGRYTVEDALIEAIETRSFRAILASLHLFSHITDWPKLYKLAKEKSSWQKVGALYEVAKLYFKINKMPMKYRNHKYSKRIFIIRDYKTKEKQFIPIEKKWRVGIPFRNGDLHKAA